MKRLNQLMTFLRLSTLVVPLIMAFGGSLAHAADAKTYPGSMGIKRSGGTPSFSYSAIGNSSSSSWMYVDLPVINDSMDGRIQKSKVFVLDRHYSSNVRCSFVRAFWYSNYGRFSAHFSANKYSNGSSNSLQTLVTTGESAGGGDYYHYYFSCAIPPRYYGNTSYITSYHVNE